MATVDDECARLLTTESRQRDSAHATPELVRMTERARIPTVFADENVILSFRPHAVERRNTYATRRNEKLTQNSLWRCATSQK